jgi:hypothetical protein
LTLEHLKNSKKLKAAKYSLAALEEVQATSLITFVDIKRKIEDLGATVSNPKSMVECKYSDSTATTPMQDMTDELIVQSKAIIWAIKNYEQILLAKQRIRDKRLVNELGFEKGRRVGDDLDRFFFRTLGELRKQQEWRYRRDAIVMAQEVQVISKEKKSK